MFILLKIFQQIEEERTLSNSACGVTLIPKLDEEKKKKEEEDYRPILLMNKDVKIFNNILASWIQQYITMILHYNKVGLNTGIQRWFNACKSLSIC